MSLKLPSGPLLLGKGAGLQIKASSFSPLSLSPELWLKASAGTNTTTDGAGVTSWADQSGHARNAAASASGTNNPLYKTNVVNGKPALLFDGLSHSMDSTGWSLSQPTTIYVVGKTTAPSGGTIFDGITTRQTVLINGSVWSFYAGSLQDSATATDTNFHVFCAVFNGASSVLYLDGASIKAANAGAGGINGFRLGNNTIPNNSWLGHIPEALVFSGAHSAANRTAMTSYLGSSYAITVA